MKIIKHRVHPGMNTIQVQADHQLKLRYINDQDNKLMGWFEVAHDPPAQAHEYEVYLALTGETIPDHYNYCTSYQQLTGGGYFVVHAYD
jgi:hypothetical protein